jgi:hypothetical protein
VTLDDQPASSQLPLHAVPPPKPSDHVTAGDFTFAVLAIGDEFLLLVSDTQSEFLKGPLRPNLVSGGRRFSHRGSIPTSGLPAADHQADD